MHPPLKRVRLSLVTVLTSELHGLVMRRPEGQRSRRYAGSFFPTARNFVVSGGVFTSNVKYVTNSLSTPSGTSTILFRIASLSRP
ncbi:hypothetical protein B0H10DRAFT_2113340 [Mycena sp. CBHHK59/15]|nr:hypothetical protein B0H10DRAFT_2113340 [Mycena sp. CBHHK59/15]